MEIEWKCKAFTDLTVQEFHDMVQLREKVFVVEQDCPYLDVDGKDPISLHLFAYDKSKMTMVAVSRIVLQKREFGEVSIGRVVTNGDYRGLSLGKKLMQNSIDKVLEMRDVQQIRLSGQEYLRRFYTELGFNSTGKEYLEDGIPHVEMLMKIER